MSPVTHPRVGGSGPAVLTSDLEVVDDRFHDVTCIGRQVASGHVGHIREHVNMAIQAKDNVETVLPW